MPTEPKVKAAQKAAREHMRGLSSTEPDTLDVGAASAVPDSQALALRVFQSVGFENFFTDPYKVLTDLLGAPPSKEVVEAVGLQIKEFGISTAENEMHVRSASAAQSPLLGIQNGDQKGDKFMNPNIASPNATSERLSGGSGATMGSLCYGTFSAGCVTNAATLGTAGSYTGSVGTAGSAGSGGGMTSAATLGTAGSYTGSVGTAGSAGSGGGMTSAATLGTASTVGSCIATIGTIGSAGPMTR